MIIGLGLDLVEIPRIAASWERFGMRFAAKILHPLEQEKMPANPASFMAARFAAKEAAVKALGTGFTERIGFHDLYVSNLPGGQPEMNFINGALERMRELGADRSLLTLTHGRDTAAAVVILTR